MDDGIGDRRRAGQRHDVAEPEARQDRQVEPAGRLGDVAERVGPGVAVVGAVGQLAGAAGVDDDDEGAHPRSLVRGASAMSRAARGGAVALDVAPGGAARQRADDPGGDRLRRRDARSIARPAP